MGTLGKGMFVLAICVPFMGGAAHAGNIMSEIQAKSNTTEGDYKLDMENRGNADTVGSITLGGGGIVAQQGNSANSKINIQDSQDKSKVDAKILNKGGSSSGASIMMGAGGQLYQQN